MIIRVLIAVVLAVPAYFYNEKGLKIYARDGTEFCNRCGARLL